MRKILRRTYAVGVIVLFALIVLVGFTQTGTFRSFLRNYLISAVGEESGALLTVGSFEGNLLTSARLRDIDLTLNGTHVIRADELALSYNPLSLIAGRLTIRSIRFINPEIHVWRGTDSLWIFERLLPPAEEDTTTSPLRLRLREIGVVNGTVHFVDSLHLTDPKPPPAAPRVPEMNYARWDVGNMMLSASADLSPSRTSVTVNQFSLELLEPAFSVREFRGTFQRDRKTLSVRNLTLVTSGSRLSLDASVEGLPQGDSVSFDAIRRARLDLDLVSDRLSSSELQIFLPRSVDFLDKSFGVELKASGTLRSLEVQQALVRTPRTFVRLQGVLANLDRPENLTIEVRTQNAILDFRDVPEYLPGLHLPDLSHLGSVTCDLSFEGQPLDFTARADARSQGSQLIAEARLNLTGEDPVYNVTLSSRDFDPVLLLGDSRFAGRVNSVSTFKGSGFDLQRMRAILRTEIDSTLFWDASFGRSAAVLDIADGTLRSHLTLQPASSLVQLSGSLSLDRSDTTSFRMEGSARGLNLSDVLHSPRWKTDLSFQLNASGTLVGGDLEQANGSIAFLRSSFGEDQFDQSTVTMSYGGADSLNRSLTFLSDAAELYVDGEFTLASLAASLENGASSFTRALTERLRQVDSSISESRTPSITPSIPSHEDRRPLPVNARMLLAIGDAYPIGVVLGSPMEGAALLEGSISGTEDSTSIRAVANVPQFALLTDPGFGLDLTTVDLQLGNLTPQGTFASVSGHLTVEGDRIASGRNQLYQCRGTLSLDSDSLLVSLSALVDSLYSGQLLGSVRYTPSGLHCVFPSVRVTFADYVVSNQEPVDILWGQEGILLQSASFQHEAEEIQVSGLVRPDGSSNVNVEVSSFLLSSLRWLFRNPALAETFSRYTGIVAASVDLEGPLDDPHILFDLNAEGVRVRQTVLGRLQGHGSYSGGVASVDIAFRRRPQFAFIPPELLIRGTIPLTSAEGAGENQVRDEAMNLEITTSGFSLEVLDPFIPVLTNLTGTVTCDMKIRGTLQRPEYEGSLRVQEGRFLFSALGLEYIVDGQLVPAGERITLQNVVVRNIPGDQPDGRATVEGYLALEGLRLKEFDLNAKGQLLVMRESAAASREILYGDLFAGIGPDGIRWRGSPSESFVSGEILIRNANLTLPPAREAFAERDRQINVVFIDDTSAVVVAQEEQPQPLSRRIAQRMERSGRGPTNTGSPTGDAAAERSSPSFLDNIVFNLTIETRGVAHLWIIINQLTNELLFADLKGRLVFTKDRSQTRLTGDVEVGQRSYYNYIRQFQASGRLRFTGDPTNPELGVKAVYEGFHRPSTVGLSPDSAEVGPDKKVTVTLNIEGTRQEPKVSMNLSLAGPSGENLPLPSQDVEADAISFLVSGKFRDELTSQERSSLLTTSLAGIGSTILSGPLTEFVRREVGFIKSVDVLYYGGPIQESTDIRLTGELGDAVYRLGGKVFSDIGNTNVNVQYPMSSILQSEAWRNFVLEYERRVEEFGTIDQRREPTNAIKLLYRITF